ncbi:uncharacterized protein JCM10292_002880 [Rhodotorula paludigena]|uniref:uncharacterized protein n=1 Tax=Rhodotorula paludigena TaxID=86838 RepID=UPI00317DF61A
MEAQKTNLNVRDALTYLDRVKMTFADQTEVYDRFLTIMKDFKSQGIDTPGVIDRVSTLFRGHPALIQGFNTFLPPGYRIECTVAPNGAGDAGSGTTITVTTPMGMTTRTQVSGEAADKQQQPQQQPQAGEGAAGKLKAEMPTASQQQQQLQQQAQSAPVATTPGAANLLSNQMAPAAANAPADVAQQQQAAQQQQQQQQQQAGQAGQQARPPMEFNHAINYVNKIKNRFIREPDTYKAFLEILQTYQKEGRAIQDVYAQVTTLFHTAPDLLDEFKQFLPDTSAEGQQAAAAASAAPAARGAAAKRAAPGQAVGGKDAAPAKRAKTGAAAGPAAGKVEGPGRGKGKRKADLGSPLVGGAGKGKGASPAEAHAMYHQHSESPDPHAHHAAHHAQAQAAAAYYYGGVAPPSAAAAYGAAAASSVPAGPAPIYAYEPPAPPPPPQPLLAPKAVPSQPDLAFFTRVKAHCKDAATYHEFLKLVNLFTQELIDLTALVARAWMFLHQDDALWAEFRDMVGWTRADPVSSDGGVLGDPGKRVELDARGRRVVENVPRLDGERWRKARGDAGKGWETYGPSYRRLPAEEISLNCSGRDALCWEVLNDEWVSQPSWASDEGFVAQRKNPYEEALHRSEEERHEYDYYIEANLRTIALLEPIATRIALMEPEERASFRLKPGLGNQSKSIYQRVLKKIYGKEQGLEVIQALHENPCVAVPIVLARLKQKDEEWKRALREWNRVWRESDAKNFLKALDHQAISLKANDKRFLNTKALVSEIESLKREQNQRSYGSPSHPQPGQYQLAYSVQNRAAFFDAIKLILSFLDRTYVVSFADKPKVDAFLHEFFALVFAVPQSEVAAETNFLTPEDDDAASNADGASEAGTTNGANGGINGAALDEAIEAALAAGSSSSIGATGSRKGKKGGDLRKKALRKTVGPGGAGADGAASGGPGSGRGRKRTAAGGAGGGSATSSRAGSPALSASAGPGDTDSVMAEASGLDEAGSTAAASREGSPVAAATSAEGTATPAGPDEDGMPEVIVPVEHKPVKLDRRRAWNVFGNSTLYCMLRLFQVLQSRLAQLRTSAAVLARPPTPQPITPSHVPTLSMSLSYAPHSSAGWTESAEHYYNRALGICEKLFDGDIDQPTFEDGIRRIMATQGYVLFTVDKILASILKLSLIAVTDNKTREFVNLLREDRAHPDRATAAQQIAYRSSAEALLGNDENFYRMEWTPSVTAAESPDGLTPITGRLAFQLMSKDVVGAEDLPAAERQWAAYVAAYVKLDRTPNLPVEPKIPYLPRNLRQLGIPPPPRDQAAAVRPKLPDGLLVVSALQSKICLRSYKMFFCADTEDLLFRRVQATSARPSPEMREKRATRVERWLVKRRKEVEARAIAAETADDKPVAVEEEEKKSEGAVGADKMEVEDAKKQDDASASGEKVESDKKDETPTASADPAAEAGKTYAPSGDVEMKA